MEIWKLLLITLLSAVLLGCIIGVLTGKHQVKVKTGRYRPLLSAKERIVYLACLLLGAGCIAYGVYLVQQQPAAGGEDAITMENGVMGVESQPGAEGGVVLDEGAALPEGEAAETESMETEESGEAEAAGESEAADDAAASETEAAPAESKSAAAASGGAVAPRSSPRRAPSVRSSGGGSVVIVG